MPKIPFYEAGALGIIKDVEAHELPAQAWTDGAYIKFRDGKAIRRAGSQQRFPGYLGRPYWLMFTYTPTNAYWMYSDETQMYATDGAVHANITHTSGVYSTINRDRLWVGGILKGIPVITNGVEVPQAWTNIGLSNPLVDLPNWPGTHQADIIKPYKDFLIALSLTKSGIKYPQMILWSHPADPGSLPISWDIADPTKLAGEVEIGDEFAGGIRDALALRDIFVIYKDNSIWGMQFIGGNDVFRQYQILGGIGILGAHCVCTVNKGTQHFFASSDDLIVFDGQNTSSVLDKRMKQWLADNIDPGVGSRAFVYSLERNNEAWFCFPMTDSEFANQAIVWNWVENTVTLRPMQAASAASLGSGDTTSDPWDLDPEVWDSDSTPWDVLKFRVNQLNALIASPGADLPSSNIYQVDATNQVLGNDYTAYIERTDIPFAGLTPDGSPKADFSMRKIGTRIWPRVKGGPCQIKVGSHEDMEQPVDWEPAQTFTPGVDRYLDFTANGLLLAVHFDFTFENNELAGFDLTVEMLGEI